MGPIEESWQNYERQRRRLNTRLGLTVLALLPLPAILIAVGLSPVRMLLAVASLCMGIGILYPMLVENEAQSTPCFGCGGANTADCLDLSANRVSLWHGSDVVMVGRNRGCRMGRFGIRRCGLFVVVRLAFLR